MTNETETQRRIHARIHGNAIERMGGFFDCSFEQAIAEILQNARRSGASQIEVRTSENGATVQDNGVGIADPQVLLSFGESGWKQTPGEKPQGFGFYALARYEPRVQSKTVNNDAWLVELKAEHFDADAGARVQPTEQMAGQHGTRVSIRNEMQGWNLAAIAEACRYLPTPVVLNGKPAEQGGYLDECVHVVEHDGVRIGVIRRERGMRRSGINFFGRLVNERRLPQVRTRGVTWETRVDVLEAGQFNLLLPNRERIGLTRYGTTLCERATRALYEAMAAQPTTDVDHTTWTQARRLGLSIAMPAPELQTWTPAISDESSAYENREEGELVDIDGSETLLFGPFDPGDEQIIARALGRTPDHGLKLRRIDSDRGGFQWYDQLRRVTGYRVEVKQNDTHRQWQRPGAEQSDWANERVDGIRMHLEITDPNTEETTLIEVNADVVMTNPELRSTPDMLGLKVLRTSNVTSEELQALIAKTCFRQHANEVDEDQRDAFESDAEDTATELLTDNDSTLCKAIERITETEIRTLLGSDRSVRIECNGEETRVVVDRKTEAGLKTTTSSTSDEAEKSEASAGAMV